MINNKSDFLPVGKIIGVHGVKGILKVISYSESPFLFKPDSSILLKYPDNRKIQGSFTEVFYKIEWVKPHKHNFLMCLKEITDCNMAEELIGAELCIEKANLPELEDGTYYWTDLIGLSVFSKKDSDEIFIGHIESIIPTGSNDVYVVKNGDKEILIPAIESVIISVNLEKKIMLVNLPEGL